jgi:hypothetical protein
VAILFMDSFEQAPLPIEPVHQGLRTDRLRGGLAERIYAEEWAKKNTRSSWINHGCTALELILTPAGKLPRPVSQRDATIAATVIQWLGTNCGHAFLQETEQRIEDERQRLAWEQRERAEAELAARRCVFPVVVYRTRPTRQPVRRIRVAK